MNLITSQTAAGEGAFGGFPGPVFDPLMTYSDAKGFSENPLLSFVVLSSCGVKSELVKKKKETGTKKEDL
jgi:hypothetical protein